jgi:hypothetical protein
MKEITLRQTVPIIFNLAGGANQGSIPFALRFSPDAVIVRQVSYASQSDEIVDICQVYSSMIDDQILFTFPVINNTTGPAGTFFSSDLDIEFNLGRRFITNTYTFQIQNSAGALVNTTDVAGVLAFMLEFVQYQG